MEKDSARGPALKESSQSIKSTKVSKRFTVGAVLSIIFLAYANSKFGRDWPHGGAPSKSPTDSIDEQENFSWTKISPEKHLQYTECFGKYQCARLEVPMDWNATSPDAPKVTIAVMRQPASVSVTDHRYGGAILINPGGPGGSGINFLGRAGEELSTIVNTPTSRPAGADARYFDFISWDPRGVNNTTPRLNCFPDAASSDVWNLQNEADGIDANSTAGVSHLWARSKALGEGCSHGNEILEHMNTAPVIADMVAIIERHGEWRSKIAESWLESCEGRSAIKNKEANSLYSKDAILERTRWRQGEEKLLYWGFSYGTLIGSTFSTLQPHRVGRIILDGVVDSTDYYHAGWLSNLQDTDPIMDHFYEYCSAAGPTKCALNLGNTTAAEIKRQVEALVPNLREDPIAVPGTATLGPEIITYSDMMQMIRNVLYSPIKRFPQMAELLADLIHGNGTTFASFKKQLHKPSCPLQGCPNPNAEPCLAPTAWETTAAIMCSDATDVSNGTKDDLKRIITTLVGQSKWMGEAWSTIAMQCIHWKARAAWTLKAEDVGGNTSHPVLLIGNTLDTVTPLRNAITMSAKFPGSVVLQQNSDGHCSGSSPSICTSKYIRDYFQTGVLPAKGVVCQPEELPLIGKIEGEERILSVEEQKVLEAMERLKDVIGDVGFFAPI